MEKIIDNQIKENIDFNDKNVNSKNIITLQNGFPSVEDEIFIENIITTNTTISTSIKQEEKIHENKTIQIQDPIKYENNDDVFESVEEEHEFFQDDNIHNMKEGKFEEILQTNKHEDINIDNKSCEEKILEITNDKIPYIVEDKEFEKHYNLEKIIKVESNILENNEINVENLFKNNDDFDFVEEKNIIKQYDEEKIIENITEVKVDIQNHEIIKENTSNIEEETKKKDNILENLSEVKEQIEKPEITMEIPSPIEEESVIKTEFINETEKEKKNEVIIISDLNENKLKKGNEKELIIQEITEEALNIYNNSNKNDINVANTLRCVQFENIKENLFTKDQPIENNDDEDFNFVEETNAIENVEIINSTVNNKNDNENKFTINNDTEKKIYENNEVKNTNEKLNSKNEDIKKENKTEIKIENNFIQEIIQDEKVQQNMVNDINNKDTIQEDLDDNDFAFVDEDEENPRNSSIEEKIKNDIENNETLLNKSNHSDKNFENKSDEIKNKPLDLSFSSSSSEEEKKSCKKKFNNNKNIDIEVEINEKEKKINELNLNLESKKIEIENDEDIFDFVEEDNFDVVENNTDNQKKNKVKPTEKIEDDDVFDFVDEDELQKNQTDEEKKVIDNVNSKQNIETTKNNVTNSLRNKDEINSLIFSYKNKFIQQNQKFLFFDEKRMKEYTEKEPIDENQCEIYTKTNQEIKNYFDLKDFKFTTNEEKYKNLENLEKIISLDQIPKKTEKTESFSIQKYIENLKYFKSEHEINVRAYSIEDLAKLSKNYTKQNVKNTIFNQNIIEFPNNLAKKLYFQYSDLKTVNNENFIKPIVTNHTHNNVNDFNLDNITDKLKVNNNNNLSDSKNLNKKNDDEKNVNINLNRMSSGGTSNNFNREPINTNTTINMSNIPSFPESGMSNLNKANDSKPNKEIIQIISENRNKSPSLDENSLKKENSTGINLEHKEKINKLTDKKEIDSDSFDDIIEDSDEEKKSKSKQNFVMNEIMSSLIMCNNVDSNKTNINSKEIIEIKEVIPTTNEINENDMFEMLKSMGVKNKPLNETNKIINEVERNNEEFNTIINKLPNLNFLTSKYVEIPDSIFNI